MKMNNLNKVVLLLMVFAFGYTSSDAKSFVEIMNIDYNQYISVLDELDLNQGISSSISCAVSEEIETIKMDRYPPGSTITIRGVTWDDSCYAILFRCKRIEIPDLEDPESDEPEVN